MTEKTIKALKILASMENGGITPNRFAMKFWGDDPERQSLFTSVANAGNGACAGKKAWLCAGSYLNKLVKKGLAAKTYNFHYCISRQGKEILNNIPPANV